MNTDNIYKRISIIYFSYIWRRMNKKYIKYNILCITYNYVLYTYNNILCTCKNIYVALTFNLFH